MKDLHLLQSSPFITAADYTYAQPETFFLSFLEYQYQKCCMSALTRFGMMASPRCSAPSRGHIAPYIRDYNEKVFTDKLCTVHVCLSCTDRVDGCLTASLERRGRITKRSRRRLQLPQPMRPPVVTITNCNYSDKTRTKHSK